MAPRRGDAFVGACAAVHVPHNVERCDALGSRRCVVSLRSLLRLFCVVSNIRGASRISRFVRERTRVASRTSPVPREMPARRRVRVGRSTPVSRDERVPRVRHDEEHVFAFVRERREPGFAMHVLGREQRERRARVARGEKRHQSPTVVAAEWRIRHQHVVRREAVRFAVRFRDADIRDVVVPGLVNRRVEIDVLVGRAREPERAQALGRRAGAEVRVVHAQRALVHFFPLRDLREDERDVHVRLERGLAIVRGVTPQVVRARPRLPRAFHRPGAESATRSVGGNPTPREKKSGVETTVEDLF